MLEDKIRRFFSDYETACNNLLLGTDGSTVRLRKAFASDFIKADPSGSSTIANNFLFGRNVKKKFKNYKALKLQSQKIASLDIIPVDLFHYMVKVRWSCWYIKKHSVSETIEFTSTYIIQHLNNELKIFAYICGEEDRVLKERGM
jgi:hypothetical protein